SARLWQSATMGEPARAALMKLRAAGTDVEVGGQPGAVPQLDASDPSLPVLLEAARTSRPVAFDYVKSGSGTAEHRSLEPWGVLSWRRRWYVAGFDRDRREGRSFRLSRITGRVDWSGPAGSFERPEKVDLIDMVAGRGPDETRIARVRVSGAGAGQLRRLADAEIDGELTIGFADTGWLARIIASTGSGAVVIDPPDLVDAVKHRLSVVAGQKDGP
ncbi:MAG: proteasome accessory factor, partial [Pseudonocardiales bacterium]|nr:proteasome accessory factor [Pseudonocardiales bacterium]